MPFARECLARALEAAGDPARAAEAAPKSRRPRIAGAAPAAVGSASDDAREVAVAIAVAALDKKAHALEILDVSGKVDYADFLVLMSGKSDRQVSALAQGIEDALRRKGRHALSIEGLPHAVWVLMDFGDVVVHVFQEDSRQLYDLDGLWMDARRIPLPSEPARA
jgi:ribosome-associated protein